MKIYARCRVFSDRLCIFYVEYNVTILNLLSNILSLSFCAAISMYCVRVRCHNTYRKALLLSSRNEQGRFYFPDVTGNCFHGGTFLLLAKEDRKRESRRKR